MSGVPTAGRKSGDPTVPDNGRARAGSRKDQPEPPAPAPFTPRKGGDPMSHTLSKDQVDLPTPRRSDTDPTGTIPTR